jgi:DNA modification methylase
MRFLDAASLPADAGPLALDDDLVIEADNADVLERLPEGAFDLIYIDPPFNTGRDQRRTRLKVQREDETGGDRTGFGGRRYRSQVLQTLSFADDFGD